MDRKKRKRKLDDNQKNPELGYDPVYEQLAESVGVWTVDSVRRALSTSQRFLKCKVPTTLVDLILSYHVADQGLLEVMYRLNGQFVYGPLQNLISEQQMIYTMHDLGFPKWGSNKRLLDRRIVHALYQLCKEGQVDWRVLNFRATPWLYYTDLDWKRMKI